MHAPPTLRAHLQFPAHATVGDPLLVEIVLESLVVVATEVKVTVEGLEGFLLDGPFRATEAALPPLGRTRLAFCLVPFQVGFVHLPQIILDTDQGTLSVTQDCTVFVRSAKVC